MGSNLDDTYPELGGPGENYPAKFRQAERDDRLSRGPSPSPPSGPHFPDNRAVGCLTKVFSASLAVAGIAFVVQLLMLDDKDSQTDADAVDLRGESVWEGDYECGSTTRGIRFKMRFAGQGSTEGAPMRLAIAYFDTASRGDNGRLDGPATGRSVARGTLKDRRLSFEVIDPPEDLDPHQMSEGTGQVRVRPENPNRFVGSGTSEECDQFATTSLR